MMPARIAEAARRRIAQAGDETVVYDFRNHQARCLNRTAAAVFKLCDGKRTPQQIAAQLSQTLGAECDEEVVAMALAQLDDGQLLDPPTPAFAASAPIMCNPAASCMGGQMNGMCCDNMGVAGTCSNGTCSGTDTQCHGQPCS